MGEAGAKLSTHVRTTALNKAHIAPEVRIETFVELRFSVSHLLTCRDPSLWSRRYVPCVTLQYNEEEEDGDDNGDDVNDGDDDDGDETC